MEFDREIEKRNRERERERERERLTRKPLFIRLVFVSTCLFFANYLQPPLRSRGPLFLCASPCIFGRSLGISAAGLERGSPLAVLPPRDQTRRRAEGVPRGSTLTKSPITHGVQRRKTTPPSLSTIFHPRHPWKIATMGRR